MARRSPNPQSYRILAIGPDVSRLSSGANVLTQAGYNADLFVAVDQAVQRAQIKRYHLAIVGSAFTRDEQIAIRSRLQQVRQHLRVLLLSDEHDSPDAFLAAVADCLKRKNRFEFGNRQDGIHFNQGIP